MCDDGSFSVAWLAGQIAFGREIELPRGYATIKLDELDGRVEMAVIARDFDDEIGGTELLSFIELDFATRGEAETFFRCMGVELKGSHEQRS